MSKELLKKWSDLNGKTIQVAVAQDYIGDAQSIWISFTDGTAAVIEYRRGYDGDCELVLADKVELDSETIKPARESGIFSDEEIAAYQKAKDESEAKRKRHAEDAELREYERLRKKFESH